MADIVFNSANLTVIGNFNPMILTHDFLINVCNFNQLGDPTSQSPRELGVVSEIVYEKFHWFMDLNRMVVENLGLGALSDFTCPKLGIRYLEILPYTPVTAAGINVHVESRLTDPSAFWERFNSPDTFIEALNKFGASAPGVISRMGASKGSFLTQEYTLAFNRSSDTRISLRIVRQQSTDQIRIDLNHEWGGLAANPASKLAEIGNTYLDVVQELFNLTTTIWPEVLL